MTLAEIDALRVNGATISLHRVLQTARLEDGFPVLDKMAEDELIRQYAEEYGVTASDDEFDAALDDYRRRLGLHRTDDTNRWLDANRITLDELVDWIEQRVLIEKVKEHLAEPRVGSYFHQHRAEFDRARIRRIVTREEDEAKELLLALEDGADFLALAREYSTDESTRHAGGYVGLVGRAKLTSAEEAAIFSGKTDTALGPFPCENGWRIVSVDQLLPAELDDRVRHAIRDTLFREWFAQARKLARIEAPLFDRL